MLNQFEQNSARCSCSQKKRNSNFEEHKYIIISIYPHVKSIPGVSKKVLLPTVQACLTV